MTDPNLKKSILIPIGGIVALLIASIVVVACGSPDLFDASISNQNDCDKEGGYWYKGKCWSDFEDEDIAIAEIDQVVKDQMAIIEKAKITFDGTTYPIDGFDVSPEGKEVLLLVNFLDKDHHLILVAKMADLERDKPFKIAGLYAIGDLEDDEDFDEKLKAQGQLNAQPLAGDLNFKITGNLTATKSDKIIPIAVQISEAITGAGSSTIEIKGNEAYLNGDLGTRTYAQLKEVIDNHPNVKTIVLGDISGSVNDAVNMHTGRILRAAGLTTKVLKNSSIASGGVDLFCAGTKRIVEKGAKIGIHSWCCLGDLTAADVPQDHPAHQYQLAYFTMCLGEKMGPNFYFHTLTAAPFDGIHWMSDADIQKWKVATEFVD